MFKIPLLGAGERMKHEPPGVVLVIRNSYIYGGRKDGRKGEREKKRLRLIDSKELPHMIV